MDISTFLRIVSLSSALLALLVLVCAHVYISLKQQAEDEAEEKLERAIANASRPVVKVEIQAKGKW